jgi:hypothetical protein
VVSSEADLMTGPDGGAVALRFAAALFSHLSTPFTEKDFRLGFISDAVAKEHVLVLPEPSSVKFQIKH